MNKANNLLPNRRLTKLACGVAGDNRGAAATKRSEHMASAFLSGESGRFTAKIEFLPQMQNQHLQLETRNQKLETGFSMKDGSMDDVV